MIIVGGGGTYLNVVIESLVLTVMLILLFSSLKYREQFRIHYPRLARAYDLMIIAWAGFSLAKLTSIPLNLEGFSLVKFSETEEYFMRMISNVICGISVGILMYGWLYILREIIGKYELVPVVELQHDGGRYTISPGLYLVSDQNPLRILKKYLSGRAAVIISRKPPGVMKRILGVEKTPIMWLTALPEENSVNPKRLEYILHMLVQFMKGSEAEKLVYLDGLEYLILENGFITVFKFLSHLKDYALTNNTIILVPIDTKSLEEKELRLLSREFKIIEDSS
ncbi:DUF835 domain-containing protein [Thermococcus sp.]|uniref:DUF835 domain-containing protein n=1 Tax=Thermococcus sp. TaxID=35749 RepID=UPI0026042F70|nr:DUF835 domain-containing protein [Thermococcus sp.]